MDTTVLLNHASDIWHWIAGPQAALGVFIGLALGWLGKTWIKSRFDRDAENYKHRHALTLQNEKARLDLYNRRLEILISLDDFYDAMVFWKPEPKPEQIAARKRFHRASQEAEFLFTKESGIAPLLDNLYRQGMRVIDFKENKESYKSDRATMHAEFNKTQDIMVRVFDEEHKKLKSAFHQYLDFLKV